MRDEIETGSFRGDLFFRIAVVEIALPPLRERREDIPALARHFLDQMAKGSTTGPVEIAPDAMRLLLTFEWPGNVRQLDNVLKGAILFRSGDTITANALDIDARATTAHSTLRRHGDYSSEESQQLLAALRASRWNVSQVSRDLGIPRATLYRKLRRYGLRRQSDDK